MKGIFLFLFILTISFTAYGQKSSDQSVGTIIITKQNNAPASVVGRIVDVDGRGVNGALVITSGIEGNPNIFYRRTNPSGYFRIIDLPSGSYAATIKIKRRVNGARLVVVND